MRRSIKCICVCALKPRLFYLNKNFLCKLPGVGRPELDKYTKNTLIRYCTEIHRTIDATRLHGTPIELTSFTFIALLQSEKVFSRYQSAVKYLKRLLTIER